jgi:hypothetical protein
LPEIDIVCANFARRWKRAAGTAAFRVRDPDGAIAAMGAERPSAGSVKLGTVYDFGMAELHRPDTQTRMVSSSLVCLAAIE